jgi:anthranilate/para-aminobenzoate synthase component I
MINIYLINYLITGMYIGVGGAIIYASDDQSEYEETLLKAKAMLKPLKNIFNRTSSILF